MNLLCGLISIALVATAQAESATSGKIEAVAIKATKAAPTADGGIELVFPSGLKITLKSSDWSREWTDLIISSQNNQSTQNLRSKPAGSVLSGIKTKCAKKWSGDFAMQKYCTDKQMRSYSKLQARPMNVEPFESIRSKCQRKWSDDYSMRDYCERKQIKAYNSLNR